MTALAALCWVLDKTYVFKEQFIQLKEYTIPGAALCHKKIQTLSPLPVFLKYDRLDLLKASGSFSDHLTSIFPLFFAWVTQPERP